MIEMSKQEKKLLGQLKDLIPFYTNFQNMFMDMVRFYERKGRTVYSIDINEQELTSCCYNCKEVNLTYLFTLKGIGETEIIQSLFETTTNLAIIILLCPTCLQKYDEDTTILINAVEDAKLLYKPKLFIAN